MNDYKIIINSKNLFENALTVFSCYGAWQINRHRVKSQYFPDGAIKYLDTVIYEEINAMQKEEHVFNIWYELGSAQIFEDKSFSYVFERIDELCNTLGNRFLIDTSQIIIGDDKDSLCFNKGISAGDKEVQKLQRTYENQLSNFFGAYLRYWGVMALKEECEAVSSEDIPSMENEIVESNTKTTPAKKLYKLNREKLEGVLNFAKYREFGDALFADLELISNSKLYEIAIVAMLIYEVQGNKNIIKVRPRTFSAWCKMFAECLGIDKSISYNPAKLREKHSLKIKELESIFYYLKSIR